VFRIGVDKRGHPVKVAIEDAISVMYRGRVQMNAKIVTREPTSVAMVIHPHRALLGQRAVLGNMLHRIRMLHRTDYARTARRERRPIPRTRQAATTSTPVFRVRVPPEVTHQQHAKIAQLRVWAIRALALLDSTSKAVNAWIKTAAEVQILVKLTEIRLRLATICRPLKMDSPALVHRVTSQAEHLV